MRNDAVMFERWLRGELHTPEQRAEMTALTIAALAGLLAVVVYVRAMERGRVMGLRGGIRTYGEYTAAAIDQVRGHIGYSQASALMEMLEHIRELESEVARLKAEVARGR